MNNDVLDLTSRFYCNNSTYLAVNDVLGKNLMLGDKGVYINVKEPYDVGLIENGKLNSMEDIMPVRYLYGTELRDVLRRVPSKKIIKKYYIKLLINDMVSILKRYCDGMNAPTGTSKP